MKNQLFLILFSLLAWTLSAQEKAVIFGVVYNTDTKEPIEFATVYVDGTSNASETDMDGNFRLEVDPNQACQIVCKRLGYQEAKAQVEGMPNGNKRYLKIKMAPQDTDIGVVIRDSKIEDIGMVREEVTDFKKMPTTSGNFESVLPNIALGVRSGTGGELSAQYNVRGGNYDENLVYVNDFEIFRPQLIRSSQQEGLSFPNIDLIRDLSFSSGGFESKYGDKLSSVLDVRYKRPEEFKASLSGSLLGASAHIEGSKKAGPNAYNQIRYLVGARYKTSAYLLGSLDTDGEYVPSFTDFQAYVTYDISKTLQLGVIGNYNSSIFNFVPESRTTRTGTFNQNLELFVLYEGQEVDGFTNGMGGLSLTLIPERKKNPMYLKLLSSVYSNIESETFDILGFYRLSEVEIDLGGDNNGEEVSVLGVGLQHTFARNYLYNRIANLRHLGGIEFAGNDEDSNHFLQWGFRAQQELIEDELNEWERLDSAGYSLPFDDELVLLNQVFKSENDITSMRYSAFVQNTFSKKISSGAEYSINLGARATYWDLNEEINISPRFQFAFKPANSQKNVSYKLAGGVYYQPPFYRELRRPDGSINPQLKSQQSIHIIGGIQRNLNLSRISDKPFKLIAELYYKRLDNLVSYEVDNVRIRYSGENDASGYVAGLDFRINGEFVPNAESWLNVSILSARETLDSIQHLRPVINGEPEEVSYVPRPTDQLVNVSVFFQDYLPNNENFKMFLNITYASPLPFGIKDNNVVFRNFDRYKPYYRADIGFSFLLWDESRKSRRPNHFLRFAKSSWFTFEVLNLMDIQNEASNIWVKSIGNAQYAIPNFLTSRRLNLRFRIDI